MNVINNDAETGKGFKKKDKVELREIKSRDVQTLKKRARTKEQPVLKETKLKGRAHKKDGVKCGLEVQT